VAYQRGNVSIDVLAKDISEARSLGLPLTLHNRQGAVSLLEQHGLLGSDFLLVHPQALTPQEIELLAKRQVKVSCAPVLENTRGINGPRGPIQFTELIAAGVQWSLSVDEVATNGRADFFGVMREMLRSDWQRVGDHTRVPARRMLEFATIEGAKALGLSDQIGSITPGKRADIILIRKTDINMTPTIGEPSVMLVFSGQPNNVDTVIVDGRRLVQGGRLTEMDIAEVCREADESARALRARDPTLAANEQSR
jgi:cytosine/adenosine deaminase-related metal-dependent hydrolase